MPSPPPRTTRALTAATVTLAVLLAAALAVVVMLAVMVAAYLNSDQDFTVPAHARPGEPLPVWYINLDSSTGRLAALRGQLRRLGCEENAERVPGCDGRDPEAVRRGVEEFGLTGTARLPPGTVACLVSHLRAVRRFLDHPRRPALGVVLEDDVVLQRTLPRTVGEFYATIGAPPVREAHQPFLLMLHPGYKGTRLRTRSSGHMNYLHPFRAFGYTNGYGAQGYLLNRPAAELILRHARDRPAAAADELLVDRVPALGLFVYVARQPFLRHREDAKSDRVAIDLGG